MSIFGISIGVASMLILSNINRVDALECSKSCKRRFGDGNCDNDCNIPACYYDGADCIEQDGYDNYDDNKPTESPTQPTKKPTKQRGTSFPTIPTSSPTYAPTQPGQTLSPTANIDKTKYNIEIVFVGSMDPKIKSAFVNAQAKWESVITNDIPNTYTYKKGTKCFEKFTKMNEDRIVDDLMIFAQVTQIDGPEGILGSAGPCQVSSSPQLYSRVGLMQFDSADTAAMVADGTVDSVILHEMGHVIGIGTLWKDYNLIQFPSRSQQKAFYKGAGGIEGQKRIQGNGKPLIETDGGQGTAYGHWDEGTYDNELMTGYSDLNAKMSLLTIFSLKDMGFTVDASKADAYAIPDNTPGLRGEEETKKSKRHLGDDIIHKPIEFVEVDPY